MRATLPWVGAIVLAAMSAASAHADYPYYSYVRPVSYVPAPCYYSASWYYAPAYCPSYCPCLPPQPFNGFRPPLCGPQGNVQGGGQSQAQVGFPVQPFMRSPRDFFMWQDP